MSSEGLGTQDKSLSAKLNGANRQRESLWPDAFSSVTLMLLSVPWLASSFLFRGLQNIGHHANGGEWSEWEVHTSHDSTP